MPRGCVEHCSCQPNGQTSIKDSSRRWKRILVWAVGLLSVVQISHSSLNLLALRARLHADRRLTFGQASWGAEAGTNPQGPCVQHKHAVVYTGHWSTVRNIIMKKQTYLLKDAIIIKHAACYKDSKMSSLWNVIDRWGDALSAENNVVSIHSFVGFKKLAPLWTENTRCTESSKPIVSSRCLERFTYIFLLIGSRQPQGLARAGLHQWKHARVTSQRACRPTSVKWLCLHPHIQARA